MTNYICKNCRYKFKSAMDHEGKTCQYCGEKGVIREPSADELLNDLD